MVENAGNSIIPEPILPRPNILSANLLASIGLILTKGHIFDHGLVHFISNLVNREHISRRLALHVRSFTFLDELKIGKVSKDT